TLRASILHQTPRCNSPAPADELRASIPESEDGASCLAHLPLWPLPTKRCSFHPGGVPIRSSIDTPKCVPTRQERERIRQNTKPMWLWPAGACETGFEGDAKCDVEALRRGGFGRAVPACGNPFWGPVGYRVGGAGAFVL